MPYWSFPVIGNVRREYYVKGQKTPYHTSITTHTESDTVSDSIANRTKTRPQVDGWRPPTPYTRNVLKLKPWTGGMRYDGIPPAENQQLWITVTGAYPDTYIGPKKVDRGWRDSNMLNRAITECLVKLKTANVDYGTFLAELDQTSKLIAGNLKSLADARNAAKRRKWSEAARHLKVSKPSFKSSSRDISGRWLELQYGWLPLLSDIHGMYEDIRKAPEPRFSVKRTIKQNQESEVVNQPNGVRIQYDRNGTYGVMVRLDYTLNNAALAVAASMGLTNPATIAWEKTRMSFLVDWAVPLGNFFSACDSTFGLIFKGGSASSWSRVEGKGTATCRRHTQLGYSKMDYFSFSYTYEAMDFGRTVFATSPVPLPYYKSPVSVTHTLNALALFRTSFK